MVSATPSPAAPAGLNRIVGQSEVVDRLGRAMRFDRLHHAYLFTGPVGVGKATTAVALAEALQCRVAPGVGCDVCPDCSRLLRDLHPDVIRVATDEKSVKIEHVRALEQRLVQGPLEGRALVAIVDDADRLTTGAANALLKGLEEPRERVHFLLVTAAPRRLPITVRSRCQAVRFAPLAEADLVELLGRQGIAPAEASVVARISEGSAARALSLVAEADLPRWQAWAERFATASATPTADVPALTKELTDELADPGPMLELLVLRLRDHLLLASGTDGQGQRLLAVPARGAEADLARRLGPRSINRKLRSVQNALRDLEYYVNKQLALEHLVEGLMRP